MEGQRDGRASSFGLQGYITVVASRSCAEMGRFVPFKAKK